MARLGRFDFLFFGNFERHCLNQTTLAGNCKGGYPQVSPSNFGSRRRVD
jgi:hypothetical protein